MRLEYKSMTLYGRARGLGERRQISCYLLLTHGDPQVEQRKPQSWLTYALANIQDTKLPYLDKLRASMPVSFV